MKTSLFSFLKKFNFNTINNNKKIFTGNMGYNKNKYNNNSNNKFKNNFNNEDNTTNYQHNNNTNNTNFKTIKSSNSRNRQSNYYNNKDDINSNEAKEKSLAKIIIDNPNQPIKLREEDIHEALKKTGQLPEEILKIILEIEKNNINNINEEIEKELEIQIYKNLNNCLNKSLIEISKVGKNSNYLKNNQKFWNNLEKEIVTRQDSLTNDQISDIISSFGKSEIKDLKIFDSLEEIITDTTVPFNVNIKNY
jgi:hypothetical protein